MLMSWFGFRNVVQFYNNIIFILLDIFSLCHLNLVYSIYVVFCSYFIEIFLCLSLFVYAWSFCCTDWYNFCILLNFVWFMILFLYFLFSFLISNLRVIGRLLDLLNDLNSIIFFYLYMLIFILFLDVICFQFYLFLSNYVSWINVYNSVLGLNICLLIHCFQV